MIQGEPRNEAPKSHSATLPAPPEKPVGQSVLALARRPGISVWMFQNSRPLQAQNESWKLT